MRVPAIVITIVVVLWPVLTAVAQQSPQDAPVAEAPSEAAPVPSRSDEAVVDMSDFCEPRRARFFPPRALQRRQSGNVELECAIADDGRPAACQIVQENPQGARFGEAALVMACDFVVQPDTGGVFRRDDGQRYIRLPFSFNLGH